MFARALYWAALAIVTLMLASVMMKGFALLQYLPGVGDFVFGAAHRFGVHGDEGIDDFHAAASGTISIVIALVAGAIFHRWYACRTVSHHRHGAGR